MNACTCAFGSSMQGPWVGQYTASSRVSIMRRLSMYCFMSPSGGEMMLVDQPMMWSPVKSAFSSRSWKHMWFDVWPGVYTHSTDQLPPVMTWPCVTRSSGWKAMSPPSSTCTPASILPAPCGP